MDASRELPKSVFYGLLAVSMAVLAVDFLFVYIPLSGWILQAVLVGVYLEYLEIKKTIIILAILEIFFMASYGGTVAVSLILGIFGIQFFIPIVAGLYFLVLGVALFLGFVTNYVFHKIRLFERLSQKTVYHNKLVFNGYFYSQFALSYSLKMKYGLDSICWHSQISKRKE